MATIRTAYAITPVEPEPRNLPKWMQRFISDVKDLWTLITQGQPADDPILPYKMMAELAKFDPFQGIDIDKWEREQWLASRGKAFWFDPARYAGTDFDWPAKRGSDNSTTLHDSAGVAWKYVTRMPVNPHAQMAQIQQLQQASILGGCGNLARNKHGELTHFWGLR